MPVYKEKNKKKITKDGRSWYYRFSYQDKEYYKLHGRNPEKKSGLFISKAAAESAEAIKKAEILYNINKRDSLNGTKTGNNEINFEIAYQEWLKDKSYHIAETSLYNIDVTLKKHVVSKFKNYYLSQITSFHILEWKDYINSAPISLSQKNKVIGYFKELLNFINILYNIETKLFISLLKIYKINPSDKKKNIIESNFYTYDEFNIFISNVNDFYWRLIFNFLYFTGVRIGELIALDWNSIDFKKKTINITKSFSNNVIGKDYIIKDPKSKNSIRQIDIPNDLFEDLLIHYNNEKNLYNFNHDLFVFGNFTHLAVTTVRRKLNQYIEIANLKKITIHGLRHSHVSLLIYLGCDSRQVAFRIGDTVQEVEKTYYHMFPQKRHEMIDILNNLSKNTAEMRRIELENKKNVEKSTF